ncbi:MAG: Transcription elongation factor GreA [Parcubacteria group bacterium ADurb.Bin326]|nr:MAG: Transcription elongation factor GreA [Parcubacteria group bacterium ADurb.Bin326]
MKENYISQEGLQKLRNELEQLKTIERPEVVDRIAKARDLGDLSENAEYHEAREKQSFIEGRIQELESLIKNAVIIESKKSDTVELGSTVHATCDNGMKIKYQIVGHSEADPASGRISHESPLGKAFIGRGIGHEFELNVPAGKLKCKIDHIE